MYWFRSVLILIVLGWVVPSYAGQVMLAWGASEGADSYRIYQGFSSGRYSTVIEVGHATTASLGGLIETYEYFWVVTASNEWGESGYSNEVSLVIPMTDVTPPEVSITTPANGSTVVRKTTVHVTAIASDEVGVVRVNMTVDGAALCSDTSVPYQCLWLVPPANKRVYRLQAEALDAAGNLGQSAIVEVTSR